jgi:hypothetical protein
VRVTPAVRRGRTRSRFAGLRRHVRVCPPCPEMPFHNLGLIHHIEDMNDSALLAIFKKLKGLMAQPKVWKPKSVDERTWRRWLAGEIKPSGHSAKSVALEIWSEFSKSDRPNLKAAVFAAVREVVPDAPCETWTEETFAAWFFDLAERENDPGGDGPRLIKPQATLDLLVWRPALHDCVSVREPGTRPLRAGDGVRVEAKVTFGADAHLYLVWLTLEPQKRLHAPFHPWNAKWSEFDRAKDIRRASLALPEDRRQTWPMNEASGLETIVLLLRRDPLPEELLNVLPGEFDAALRSVKGKPNPNHLDFLHEFVYPEETVIEPVASQTRLADFLHPISISDPIYELTCALRDKLGSHFDLIRTLTVTNVGKEKRG